MRALVWHGPGDVRLEERRRPTPNPDQVLVAMKAVGICGSDVSLYKTGTLGTLKPAEPFVMAHEGTGRVVELGERVQGVAVGDRVAVNPQLACGRCTYCRRGEENLCEDLSFNSVSGDGVLAETVAVHSDQAVGLPENVDHVTGTAIEPLSVAVQAVRRSGAGPGDDVLVLGAGTVGLLAIQVALSEDVGRVAAADVRPSALTLARELGAAEAIDCRARSVMEAVRESWNGGRGPDVVLETAGSPETQSAAVSLARPGGTVVLVGISAHPAVGLDVNRIVRSNLDVRGTVRTSGDAFLEAARLVEAGRVSLAPLISRVYRFEEAEEALRQKLDPEDTTIKCVVRFEGG